MALGYDKLDVKGATVLAAWEGGDPAVTVNKIGKGYCYFYSAVYPGMAHTTSGWEMHPLFKDFWPGARELVAAMVRGGLKQTGQTLAATIVDGPEQVELTVRTQADKRRWMLHLLNYDPYMDRVRGVDVTVNPPASDSIEVLYGDDKTQIPFVRTGKAITFRTRNFGVHDMIVVQY